MSVATDRAARLDALIKAIDQWVKTRSLVINKTIKSQKKIIAARGQPAQQAADSAAAYTVEQLKEFTG